MKETSLSRSLLPVLIFSVAPLHAQSTGGPYSITGGSMSSCGGRTQSASYRNDFTSGATSYGSSSSSKYSSAGGFSSTIRDFVEFVTGPGELSEGASVQLGLFQKLDDSTLIAADEAGDVWETVSGELIVASGGFASAPAVYEDRTSQVRVTSGGTITNGSVIVRNTDDDDFGIYAADGLADSWQVDNFGLDNPDAAPTRDPDGDGQDNAFEFTAGLVPTDAASRFRLTIKPVPGEPLQKEVVFAPIVPGRTYTVMSSIDLTPLSWEPLTGAASADEGNERTVTDPAGGNTRRFYRVKIEAP